MNINNLIQKFVTFKTLDKVLLIFSITFIVYFGSFLLVFSLGLNDKPFQSEDYIGTAVVPLSILKEGNLNVNEYYDVLSKAYPQPDNPNETPYYLKKIGENYYSIRPITTSILALPIYIIPALFDNDLITVEILGILSHAGGAFITAISCAIFYLIVKRELSEKESIVLTLIYAFATNSLSTSGQGLWQHGSSQLLIALGIYLIYKNRQDLSALSLGLATIARPTNLLSLVVLGAFVFFNNREKGIRFFIIGAIPVILEFVFNFMVFGNADNNEYGEQMTGWTLNILEGFLGLWISPSKGLLICSPFLIFILPTIYKRLRYFKASDIFSFFAAIAVFHTFVMGMWYSWYGGYSWGNRIASDILPILILLLIPFIKSKYYADTKIKVTFFLLAFFGFIYHFLGIIYFDGLWHTIFDGKQANWLWSIKDSQIVFTFKRILNKLGLIEDPISEALQRLSKAN